MHTSASMLGVNPGGRDRPRLASGPSGSFGDPVLWIGIASCTGALAIAHPVLVAITSTIIGGLLCLRARWVAVLALAALLFGFARASWTVARYESDRAAVVEAGGWPSRCSLRGSVVRSPTFVSGGLRVDVAAAIVEEENGARYRGGRVSLHVPAAVVLANVPMMGLARGDQISATASLAPPYRFWNDGVEDPRPSAARRAVMLSGGAEDLRLLDASGGLLPWIDRVRARVRQRIVTTFPAETSPMARALVLGEDDLLESDRRAFRKSGLAHLLAVSGMHLVLVVTGFVAALRAVLVRLPVLAERTDVARIASAVGLFVAWVYADLAGGSGSAVRAAWMCTVVLVARVLARHPSAWRGLGLSMLAMSVLDPLVTFDVSFVLSTLATLGIIALARPLEAVARRALARARVVPPSFILGPIATSAAATITCAPVLASMSFELPIGGLVANVVAVPLGEAAALPLCLAHAALAIWPAAEHGAAIAASGALAIVRIVARVFGGFGWGVLSVPPPTATEHSFMAVELGLVAFAASNDVRTRWLPRRASTALFVGSLVILTAEVAARRAGAPHGVLRATFLDVGQGDSALIDLPDGSAMLVDGGGLVGSPVDVGERAVLPLLAARRRKELVAVVLSHPHPDHYLGLSAGLARANVRELWDTGQGEADGTGGGYRDLLTDLRRRGTVVKHPGSVCGAHAVGGAIVDVLAPCPEVQPDRGANDNSFVIRIRYGTRAILLVGDAEHDAEADLVRTVGADGLHADVLKVGHHGSRTSSTRGFIDAVSPTVAVVSCGVRNRFGHPHPNTLATLRSAGVRVLRTDVHGSVVVTTDGTSLDVRSMIEER